ncbi:MAG: hypothetical protein GC164_09000 [Phycisphaera sp.]|nr:hypothetical protein [Phycisphaera sp.]
MTYSMTLDVMVVAIDDAISGDLELTADRNGWALFRVPSLKAAMKQVMSCQPRIVIVQVSKATDAALQLVRMLKNSWRKVSLLVTAKLHTDDIEREARLAGANCYVPDGESGVAITRYVNAMLAAERQPAGAPQPASSTSFDRVRFDHGGGHA